MIANIFPPARLEPISVANSVLIVPALAADQLEYRTFWVVEILSYQYEKGSGGSRAFNQAVR